MSSVGQGVGGVIGAVIGFYLGGPSGAIYGAQIGMAVGGAIDPPKGPTIRGPRLQDLTVQTSTYGADIPRVYETVAITGNVFWLEGDKLKEVEETGDTGGKGGGPVSETETYSYYATFAVGLCKGPISAIRRVWVGPKLIYDVGSDDIAQVLASNQTAAKTLRFYLGTETQEPDPRIQADRGIDATPAYRGLAYIVFYDLPLKDYGNTLMGAQVRVEVMKDATGDSWGRQVNVTDTGIDFAIHDAPGVGKPYITKVKKGVIEVAPVGSNDRYKFNYVGHSLGKRSAGKIANHGNISGIYCVGQVDDVYLWALPEGKPITGGCVFKGDLSYAPQLDSALNPDRPLIGLGLANDGKSFLAIQGDPAIPPGGTHFDVIWSHVDHKGRLLATGVMDVDDISGVDSSLLGYSRAVTNFYTASSFDSVSMTFARAYGAGTNSVQVWRVDDANVLTLVHTASFGGASFSYPSVWVDADIVFVFAGDDYNVFSLPAIPDSFIELGEIVRQECVLSGVLTNADLETNDLTQLVRGYRVASVGALRGAITPLQSAWPFDVVQRGYKLAFIPRGQVASLTINPDDLDARPTDESPQPAITISREMDTQIPYKVDVSYLDVTRDLEISQQTALRTGTDSIGVTTIELPVVLDKDEAAKVADVLLRLYWLERQEVGPLRLPPSYLGLEPSDVIAVSGFDVRLVSVDYMADGRLECFGKLNSPAVYDSVALGSGTTGALKPIDIFGDSNALVLDAPLLVDAGDVPGFLFAATGVLEAWRGCGLFRTKDNGQTFDRLSITLPPGSTIGACLSAVGPGRFDIVDASSVIDAFFLDKELSSVTIAQMLSGSNWFAFGAPGRWEIIAAQNCELIAANTYRMTDLLRGRCGTEWAAELHEINDYVVLLDPALIHFVKVESSEIGQTREYEVVTFGDHVNGDDLFDFEYTAVNLMPISPIGLNGNRHPVSNDWSLSWVRRARKDNTWRNGVDVPLDEPTEQYEIEIYGETGMTTLKRTITGLSSPAVAYTSAQQVSDFGSNQPTLHVKIYQISSRVGRGFPLVASISR